MARRIAPSSASGGRPSAGGPQTYEGTYSGYGATRGDSVGYDPRNPYAYGATKAVKAYNTKTVAPLDAVKGMIKNG